MKHERQLDERKGGGGGGASATGLDTVDRPGVCCIVRTNSERKASWRPGRMGRRKPVESSDEQYVVSEEMERMTLKMPGV